MKVYDVQYHLDKYGHVVAWKDPIKFHELKRENEHWAVDTLRLFYMWLGKSDKPPKNLYEIDWRN